MELTNNHKVAESYLNAIRSAEELIHKKELELEALRWKASGITAIEYDKDKVQTSPQNYMEMAIVDCNQLEAEIEEDKASIEEQKGTAYIIVRRMEDPEQRAIIEWYYLNYTPMTEVALKMCMSERNAYYLRDDALEIFGGLLTF